MKYLSIVLGLMLLAICNHQQESPEIFSRMEGIWQRTEKADNFESWEGGPNGSLEGENYRMEGKNKKILEKIIIKKKDNSWYYIPDVPHNPAPVSFQIVDMGDDFFYSENPEHDFPKWIRYEFLGLDSITVTIGDNMDTVQFRFNRFH